MFNPLNFISKFVKSSNQKELDRIGKIVGQINLLEENIKELADEEFPKKTNELKEIMAFLVSRKKQHFNLSLHIFSYIKYIGKSQISKDE